MGSEMDIMEGIVDGIWDDPGPQGQGLTSWSWEPPARG